MSVKRVNKLLGETIKGLSDPGDSSFEDEEFDGIDLDAEMQRIMEALWSANVVTKWSPPEGFFRQSADKIAAGLKKASKTYKQAMSRLNFYINRAGKNLSDKDKKRLASARKKLAAAYA